VLMRAEYRESGAGASAERKPMHKALRKRTAVAARAATGTTLRRARAPSVRSGWPPLAASLPWPQPDRRKGPPDLFPPVLSPTFPA